MSPNSSLATAERQAIEGLNQLRSCQLLPSTLISIPVKRNRQQSYNNSISENNSASDSSFSNASTCFFRTSSFDKVSSPIQFAAATAENTEKRDVKAVSMNPYLSHHARMDSVDSLVDYIKNRFNSFCVKQEKVDVSNTRVKKMRKESLVRNFDHLSSHQSLSINLPSIQHSLNSVSSVLMGDSVFSEQRYTNASHSVSVHTDAIEGNATAAPHSTSTISVPTPAVSFETEPLFHIVGENSASPSNISACASTTTASPEALSFCRDIDDDNMEINGQPEKCTTITFERNASQFSFIAPKSTKSKNQSLLQQQQQQQQQQQRSTAFQFVNGSKNSYQCPQHRNREKKEAISRRNKQYHSAPTLSLGQQQQFSVQNISSNTHNLMLNVQQQHHAFGQQHPQPKQLTASAATANTATTLTITEYLDSLRKIQTWLVDFHALSVEEQSKRQEGYKRDTCHGINQIDQQIHAIRQQRPRNQQQVEFRLQQIANLERCKIKILETYHAAMTYIKHYRQQQQQLQLANSAHSYNINVNTAIFQQQNLQQQPCQYQNIPIITLHNQQQSTEHSVINPPLQPLQMTTAASKSEKKPISRLYQLIDISDEEDDDDDDDNDAEDITRVNRDTKNGKSDKKPRWTPDLKRILFSTIIEQKQLSDMASFNWPLIGAQVGRPGKACKDQWRRAILPRLQQTFLNVDGGEEQ